MDNQDAGYCQARIVSWIFYVIVKSEKRSVFVKSNRPEGGSEMTAMLETEDGRSVIGNCPEGILGAMRK